MNNSNKAPGVLDIVRSTANGELKPQEVINASHARASELESELHAFAFLLSAPPRASATGPLAGVAIGVKDLMDTADMPTTYGSAIYVDHQPNADAWAVARLKDLSATILGKTITTEFAYREPGPTRNPWNIQHTPGGSSSGSAASVASGSVPIALGTQTLGSVLRPASFCGVVGFKPSFGSISLQGVHALSQSLDHLGLFARSVDDVAYVAALLIGGPGATRHASFEVPRTGVQPFAAPRIALLVGAATPALEECQSKALANAAAKFKAAGAMVESFTLPKEFDELAAISATLSGAEGAANFGDLVKRFPDKTSARLQAMVENGNAILAKDFIAARTHQLSLRARFTDALKGFDALLTVAATGEAPEGLANTGDPSLCVPWTTLGVPAIALPVDKGPRGLPVGIQLVTAFGENFKLLRIAKFCEATLGR